MPACFTQPRNVSGTTPARGPIRSTTWFTGSDGSSALASVTRRCARSRSSGGYFLGCWHDPPSCGIRPSTNPGAVHPPRSVNPRIGTSSHRAANLTGKESRDVHRSPGAPRDPDLTRASGRASALKQRNDMTPDPAAVPGDDRVPHRWKKLQAFRRLPYGHPGQLGRAHDADHVPGLRSRHGACEVRRDRRGRRPPRRCPAPR
jgi:hypothetical protein